MQDDLRKAEYDSIRTEMLSAVERAFSFWKWGLVSLFSVYASFLLSMAKTKPEIDQNSVSLLHAAFVQYPICIAAILIIFSVLVIMFIAWIVCEIEASADRLGSYLAVFYERGDHLSDYKKVLGWHVWNRIEKSFKKSKIEFTKAAAGYVIYKQKSLIVYVGILVLLVFTLFGLVTVSRGIPQWSILIMGGFALAVVSFGIYFLDRRTRYAPTYWNKRWMDLSTRNDDEIKEVLKRVGLERLNTEQGHAVAL